MIFNDCEQINGCRCLCPCKLDFALIPDRLLKCIEHISFPGSVPYWTRALHERETRPQRDSAHYNRYNARVQNRNQFLRIQKSPPYDRLINNPLQTQKHLKTWILTELGYKQGSFKHRSTTQFPSSLLSHHNFEVRRSRTCITM